MKVGKTGHHSDIRLKGVTPAECLVLSHEDDEVGHSTNAGGFPLSKLEITGDALKLTYEDTTGLHTVEEGEKVLRSDKQEVERLKRKYKPKTIDLCFPGAAPKLPTHFSEIAGWDPDTCQKVVDKDAPKVAIAEPKK